MNTATKLGGFAAALVVVFGAAYGAGQFTGPVTAAGTSTETGKHAEEGGHGDDGGHGEESGGGDRLPGGLLVSDRGYTLTTVPAAAGEFAFRIVGPEGRAVTGFDVEHDKRMHLIVARRDLSGFRHVHPEMAADGTWRVASPLGEPGTYRAFADFKPTDGEALTLGIDVEAPGAYAPRPLPAPAATTTVDDYTVSLAGAVKPGATSKLTLSVSRAGAPVTDLEPYLGAYGHLVALRSGDLAYLHVHPDGAPGDGKTEPGPAITFYAEVPSVGTYRLYLDFQHQGTVRTAEFTVVAGQPAGPTPSPAAPAPTPTPSQSGHGEPGHGH